MEPMTAPIVDTWRRPQPVIEELSLEDKSINRYVWYPGEDIPWPEIHGGFIRRCRVAYILPFRVWERIMDVPRDMRKALRRDLMDREHQEAQYEIPPQGIFESIMGQYGVWGVKELSGLQGMAPKEVAALNIDLTFCPWHWDEIPKPYRIIEDQIKNTLRSLNGNQLLHSVGEDMLQSLTAAKAYDEMLVDEEESRKELKYSRPGLRALSRLERQRRDTALNNMAASQNKVFEKIPDILAAQSGGHDPALVEMLKAQQEQNELLREELAMNREALNALLADRQAPTPARRRRARNAE